MDARSLAALYPSAAGSIEVLDAPRAAPAAAPPASAVAPASSEPPAAQSVQGAAQPAREASAPAAVGDTLEPEVQEPPAAAAALYDRNIDTHTLVKWDERPAQAADIHLEWPRDDPTSAEDRQRLVQALSAAGVGETTAREVWADALAANSRPITSTKEQCRAELRKAWGSQTDSKLAAAAGLVRKVAETFPEVHEFLSRSGLGNSPAFIRKLAARAAALERQR